MLMKCSLPINLLLLSLLFPLLVAGQTGGPRAAKVRTAVQADARQAAEGSSNAVRIEAPILGFVFDPAAAGLRPIHGIPGAAVMGERLDLGFEIASAAISPQHNYALVESDDPPGLSLVLLAAGPASLQLIPDAVRGADQILFSPRGDSALLYRATARRIQVLAGMPKAPSLIREIDTSVLLEPISALAISDDARAVLVAVGRGGAGTIWLFADDGGVRFIAAVGQASAVTFLSNSHDAVVADRLFNYVYQLKDVTGSADSLFLAGEREGIAGPVAVALSDDNQRVFIANSVSGTVLSLSLAGGAAVVVPCDCSIKELHRLSGSAVFRLTEPSAGPMLVFDGDSSEPRFVYVPGDPGPEPTAPRASAMGGVRQ
jgi:hypothetical protein